MNGKFPQILSFNIVFLNNIIQNTGYQTQKSKRRISSKIAATNLSTLVLLNQKKDKKVEEEVEGEEEEEKQKNKDLIAIDVAGRTYIQRDNDAKSSKISDETSILTDKSLR